MFRKNVLTVNVIQSVIKFLLREMCYNREYGSLSNQKYADVNINYVTDLN